MGNEKQKNTKANAWDLIGEMYWTKMDAEGRPTEREIMMYVGDLDKHCRLAILGASTRGAVELALSKGIATTVFDFSEAMCIALEAAYPNRDLEVIRLDLTKTLPHNEIGKFDAVIADRLITRFSLEEAKLSIRNIVLMAKEGGTIKLGVKIGLQDTDTPLIKEGQIKGTVDQFFDRENYVIDYSRVGQILDDHLIAHGEIPREVLLAWYRGRGAEKRFRNGEFANFISEHAADVGGVALLSDEAMDAQHARLYTFRQLALLG